MSILTKFIAIVLSITLAAAAGYFCRRRQWVSEGIAGPLMFHTVVFGWTPVSIVVLWSLELQWSLVALPIIGMLLPLAMAPVGFALLKLHRLDRASAGTFVVTCGLSNIGMTMGGFICYCLFGLPGLSYVQLYTMSWSLPFICCYYPIGRWFDQPGEVIDLAFIFRTIFDRRSLPMVGAIVGLILNLYHVTMPPFIFRYHFIDLLLIPSVLLSFFAVGLQVHFADLSHRRPVHLSLSLAKFIIAPTISLGLLTLAGLLGANLPQLAWKVVVIEGFMPAAVFSVIISNLFHLNSRLASLMFLVNTILFLIFVLPILMVVFG